MPERKRKRLFFLHTDIHDSSRNLLVLTPSQARNKKHFWTVVFNRSTLFKIRTSKANQFQENLAHTSTEFLFILLPRYKKITVLYNLYMWKDNLCSVEFNTVASLSIVKVTSCTPEGCRLDSQRSDKSIGLLA
jgi:hypothetical protein